MLCIVSISKAKLPEGSTAMPDDLSKILTVSRANNQKNGITSALVYRQGQFLQFIEGEARDVDRLYQTLSTDQRHEGLEKLIDIPVSERTFTGSDMALLLSIQEDERFVNFIAEHKEMILSQRDNIFSKLEHFSSGSLSENLNTSTETEAGSKQAFSVVGKSFSLKEEVDLDWFEIVWLEPELAVAGIALSEELVKYQYSYKQLVDSERFGDPEQLSGLLKRLNSTGSLLVEETTELDNADQHLNERDTAPSKKRVSFGEKVLFWLNKDIMSYRKPTG